MPRTFSLVSAKDPGTLVARARRVAIENGADFRGNETSGSFSASGVKGVYRMEKKLVTVTIPRTLLRSLAPDRVELTRLLV